MAINSRRYSTFNVSIKATLQPDSYAVNALYLGPKGTEFYGVFDKSFDGEQMKGPTKLINQPDATPPVLERVNDYFEEMKKMEIQRKKNFL